MSIQYNNFVDLVLYSYDAEFMQKIAEAKAFNLKFWYMSDVLSINNANLERYLYLPSKYSVTFVQMTRESIGKC